ncbi:MAG: S-layer homology domain-containing protein [Acidaminobacteraceae bacterium]
MKKLTCIIITLIMCFSTASFAVVAGIDGGVVGDPLITANTFEYSEVTFITGQPVLLKGTVVIPDVDTTKESYSTTYSYELQNTDNNILLSKKITYQVDTTKDLNVNQTVLKANITKLDEQYTVDSVSYTLASYLFDKSILYDNTPAVDYYSGNIYSKRVFYKNGDAITNEGKFTIETNTESLVGYKHKWGAHETEVINQNFNFEYPNPAYTGTTDSTEARYKYWSGSATLRMASTDKISFQMQKTDPQNISFRGNYIETKTQENILSYDYNLPTISADTYDDNTRVKDSYEIRLDVVLDNSSKITPKIKDIGGHWAEDNIFLLASIGIYDNIPSYYMPDLPISRIDFAKELTRAITDELDKYDDDALLKKEMLLRQRPTADLKPNFEDIDPASKESLYTEYVRENGIMNGVGFSGEYFRPYRSITREEAVTILIRSLGLVNLAPTPPYKTVFVDDAAIQGWSKASIYVSNEIQLVEGYNDGKFRPSKEITKAEAASLINKFIVHLKDKITVDYREKVMNKY